MRMVMFRWKTPCPSVHICLPRCCRSNLFILSFEGVCLCAFVLFIASVIHQKRLCFQPYPPCPLWPPSGGPPSSNNSKSLTRLTKAALLISKEMQGYNSQIERYVKHLKSSTDYVYMDHNSVSRGDAALTAKGEIHFTVRITIVRTHKLNSNLWIFKNVPSSSGNIIKKKTNSVLCQTNCLTQQTGCLARWSSRNNLEKS